MYNFDMAHGKEGARTEVIEEILDADEVAKMLRVHPRTVMRLASQGQLPGFKVGGQWRFRREAIDEYIRKQEQRYGDQKEDEHNHVPRKFIASMQAHIDKRHLPNSGSKAYVERFQQTTLLLRSQTSP